MSKQKIQASSARITESIDQVIHLVDGFGEVLASNFPDDPAVPAAFNEAKRSLQRVSNLVVAKYDVLATRSEDDDSPGRSQ
tara:strand:- start:35106 stop:35348 length:243 start_codon:yes stop_codon:yes gene_type:complete